MEIMFIGAKKNIKTMLMTIYNNIEFKTQQ